MGNQAIQPRRMAHFAKIADRELARLAPTSLDDLPLPVDIGAIARWHGLAIRRVDGDLYAQIELPNLHGTPLSGMFDFRNGEILVRANQSPARQRFTIAHEIAHYLIDDHRSLYGGSIRYTTTDIDGTPRDVHLAGSRDERRALIERAESEADELASLIIMPRSLVDLAVAELGPSVPLLCERFDVSAAAMRRSMGPYLPRVKWMLEVRA